MLNVAGITGLSDPTPSILADLPLPVWHGLDLHGDGDVRGDSLFHTDSGEDCQ